MRRGIPRVLAVALLGCVTPTVWAQYPYPYAPPTANPFPIQPMPAQAAPMQYMPPYGYPGPMMMRPAMYPPYPQPRPVYFYPPQMQGPPAYSSQLPPPRMLNYGPLDRTANPTAAVSITDGPQTNSTPARSAPPPPANGVVKTNLTKTDYACEGCGSGVVPPPESLAGACSSGCCLDGCDSCPAKLPPVAPPHPLGHFIGEVGMNFLVPYPDSRVAYTSSNAGSSSTTNFSHEMDYAPYFSLGYVFHDGWGVRGDFWYMHGNNDLAVNNADPNTTITSPAPPPNQISSPGVGVQNGIGADHLTFNQNFDFKVADLEVIKECNVFDMQFTFGAGVRYAYMSQGNSDSRSNPGGFNAAGSAAVTQDSENLNLVSCFEGMGPTLSLEMVHPIRCTCFSFYSNLRGSFLFGVERLHEDYSLQNAVTVTGAAPAITSVNNSNEITSNRMVSVTDVELGIQIGQRLTHCYIYGRLGAVYSRWWDVGNPVNSNGNLDILGAALRFGVIY